MVDRINNLIIKAINLTKELREMKADIKELETKAENKIQGSTTVDLTYCLEKFYNQLTYTQPIYKYFLGEYDPDGDCVSITEIDQPSCKCSCNCKNPIHFHK